jgi:hypothetical protein
MIGGKRAEMGVDDVGGGDVDDDEAGEDGVSSRSIGDDMANAVSMMVTLISSRCTSRDCNGKDMLSC